MFRKCFALVLIPGLLVCIGCGSKLSSVEGTVTLDGKPVDKATVTYMPEDAKGLSASGMTDSSGKFTLATGNKPGARPGKYKVLVTKIPAVQSDAETMKPGSPDYIKQMGKSKGEGGGGPMGMMMMGGMGPKSELPGKYSSASTTPLTEDVPPATKPVELKLASK